MNLLEEVTYEDVPEEYKKDVRNGKWTEEEALREYKNDLYFAEIDEREIRQQLEESQMGM